MLCAYLTLFLGQFPSIIAEVQVGHGPRCRKQLFTQG